MMTMELANAVSIVFVDVDGVLNRNGAESPSLGIDQDLLANLATLATCIIRAGGDGTATSDARTRGITKIVLSSDHRRVPALAKIFKETIEAQQLSYGGCIHEGSSKIDAIKLWLAENGSAVANWIAIDDIPLQEQDCLMSDAVETLTDSSENSLFAGHFVQTDEKYGLTADKTQTALEFLQAPWTQKESDLSRLQAWRHGRVFLPWKPITKTFKCDECEQILLDEDAVRAHMLEAEHVSFSET
eukprot:TRINITY_DN32793_c0_g1_i1.p1 TRINITY_DN32793_c0_g1~~TRINITY_DN32793_c0_g1_i1.p1  ORF type:complete len:244 (+),score=41.80 TRINITY_DN32793_c0_g1_i1:131-862(+)